MGIDSLKIGFLSYLEELNKTSENKYATASGDVSIFMYASEFKTYLQDEHNISNEILSMSISEILDLEIENGKVVEDETTKEETNIFETTENKNENAQQSEDDISKEISSLANFLLQMQAENKNTSENTQEETTQETQGNSNVAGNQTQTENTDVSTENQTSENPLISEFLDLFFDDKNITTTIDTDKNGEYSEEELTAFLTAIKDLDGNGENISMNDLFGSVDAIKNNKLDLETTTKEEAKVEDTQSTDSTNSTDNSTGGNTFTKSTGDDTTNTQNDTPQEKPLDQMTKDELKTELGTAQTKLSDNQNILNSILDGSEPNLKALQETMDNAYETYQEELKKVDEDMAKELDIKKEAVTNKEEEIDKKTKEISDQEITVSNAETTYNNAVSTRETLESSLSALEAADTSSMSDEEKADISAKIADLKTKIEAAKTAESDAKTAWDDAKEQLKTLNEQKATLDGELTTLKEDLTAYEQQIAEKYPEIKQYQEAYDTAKKNHDELKTQLIDGIKVDIKASQDRINEVNTALTNLDNKNTEKEYSLNTLGEDFVEFAKKFLGANEADGSADKFLASWTNSKETPWCAAFVQYILENGGNKDKLPDWYKNIENKWYCPNIQNAAENSNSIIDGKDAQAGDLVLMDWNGDGTPDHVGIVVSNENGKITTIEGNASNRVKEKTYEITDGRLKFCNITN